MATETLSKNADGSTSLPYVYNGTRTSAAAWSTIVNSVGTSAGVGVECRLLASSTSNQYSTNKNIIAGFDLLNDIGRAGWRITSGYIAMYMQYESSSGALWSTDSQRGIACIAIDESVKSGLTVSTTEDYDATRIPRSGLTAAGWKYWNFNAAGLAYLNSVPHKAVKTGSAWFGFVFGGQADNVTPTWVSVKDEQFIFYDANDAGYEPRIYLEIEPLCKINIGDVWKNAWEAKINIGDTWKTVQEIQVNVGDVWKDL